MNEKMSLAKTKVTSMVETMEETMARLDRKVRREWGFDLWKDHIKRKGGNMFDTESEEEGTWLDEKLVKASNDRNKSSEDTTRAVSNSRKNSNLSNSRKSSNVSKSRKSSQFHASPRSTPRNSKASPLLQPRKASRGVNQEDARENKRETYTDEEA